MSTTTPHIDMGNCPSARHPLGRDYSCAACQELMHMAARRTFATKESNVSKLSEADEARVAIKVDGACIYKLNEQGSNEWSAQVQPGWHSDGTRMTLEECAQIAAYLASRTAAPVAELVSAAYLACGDMGCYCDEASEEAPPCSMCALEEAAKAVERNATRPSAPVAQDTSDLLTGGGISSASRTAAPVAQSDDFTVKDDDVNLLLNLGADIATGNANMDTGIWWLDTLEKVMARLGKDLDGNPLPAPQPGAGMDVEAALAVAEKARTLSLGLMISQGSARTRLHECADTIRTLARQLSAAQVVVHWAVSNPGLADQYRAEALACRRALGFDANADDVAPVDLTNAISRQLSAAQEPEGLTIDKAEAFVLLALSRRALKASPGYYFPMSDKIMGKLAGIAEPPNAEGARSALPTQPQEQSK